MAKFISGLAIGSMIVLVLIAALQIIPYFMEGTAVYHYLTVDRIEDAQSITTPPLNLTRIQMIPVPTLLAALDSLRSQENTHQVFKRITAKERTDIIQFFEDFGRPLDLENLTYQYVRFDALLAGIKLDRATS